LSLNSVCPAVRNKGKPRPAPRLCHRPRLARPGTRPRPRERTPGPPRMTSPAPGSRRTLAVLCLASMGWAFSFALGVEVAPLWLKDAGFSPKAIGLNTSVYYLGVAVASVSAPRLMGRAGRRCVVAGMLADALVTALLPWAGGAAAWFALRAVAGAATAMSLIPMETLVNHNAAPERRARDFGVYAFG